MLSRACQVHYSVSLQLCTRCRASCRRAKHQAEQGGLGQRARVERLGCSSSRWRPWPEHGPCSTDPRLCHLVDRRGNGGDLAELQWRGFSKGYCKKCIIPLAHSARLILGALADGHLPLASCLFLASRGSSSYIPLGNYFCLYITQEDITHILFIKVSIALHDRDKARPALLFLRLADIMRGVDGTLSASRHEHLACLPACQGTCFGMFLLVLLVLVAVWARLPGIALGVLRQSRSLPGTSTRQGAEEGQVAAQAPISCLEVHG